MTIQWNELSEAFAFLGNSLLNPMSQNSTIGLKAEFWKAFPTFGDEGVQAVTDALACFANSEAADEHGVNVEFTRLFVGPPKPAAAPWETAYRGGAEGVMFGAATHEMRAALREAGVALDNSNKQYEDHMGIELLLASVLCGRVAEGETAAQEEAAEAAVAFMRKHPASWMEAFEAAVSTAAPGGYYAGILALAKALLGLIAK